MAVFGSLGLLAVTAGLGILLFFRGWLEPDGEKSPSQFAYSLEHPGQIVLEPGDPLASIFMFCFHLIEMHKKELMNSRRGLVARVVIITTASMPINVARNTTRYWVCW